MPSSRATCRPAINIYARHRRIADSTISVLCHSRDRQSLYPAIPPKYLVHPDAHVRERERLDRLAAPERGDPGVGAAGRLAVLLDDSIRQVHDPVLGDAGARVELGLFLPVELQGRVGHLDDQECPARVRVHVVSKRDDGQVRLGHTVGVGGERKLDPDIRPPEQRWHEQASENLDHVRMRRVLRAHLDHDPLNQFDALVAEKPSRDHALVLLPAKGSLSFGELTHGLEFSTGPARTTTSIQDVAGGDLIPIPKARPRRDLVGDLRGRDAMDGLAAGAGRGARWPGFRRRPSRARPDRRTPVDNFDDVFHRSPVVMVERAARAFGGRRRSRPA
jgi:hypothetical protein